MNCKQGDLAIVIGADRGDGVTGVAGRLCLGRVVRCAVLCGDGVWDFETEIDLGRVHFKVDGFDASADIQVIGLHDRYLRPVSGLPIDEDVRDEVAA